jgi:hypothetical protein
VALILGHLRMNVSEAIDTLLDVASAIFPEEPQQTPDLEMNTSNLKEAIEGVLQRREVSLKTKMNDPNYPPTNCKVYVSSIHISSQISFLEGCYMRRHQLDSTILNHFVPIPRVARVLTRPLSKPFVPR